MSSTANPRHPDNPPSDPSQEPTGPVAKDSLAAESIKAGGAFADNENPEILGVKGGQSTLATQDHSNAETLKAAASGAEREGARGSTTQYPDAEAGQNLGGTHSLDGGFVGGPTNPSASSTTASTGESATQNFGSDKPAPDASKISSSGTSHATTSSSHPAPAANTGARPHVDQAPNYTIDTAADEKPKGKNLVEGGDLPEKTGTHTGAVTGPNDPGRLAEKDYTKFEAAGAGTQDYTETQKQGEGQYDVLDNHERA